MNPVTSFNLTRSRYSLRNCKYSVHRFDGWGMVPRPSLHDEQAERTTSQDNRRSRNRLGVGGIDLSSKRIQKDVLSPKHVSLTVKHRGHIAAANGVKQRQEFVTNTIADIGRIVIRRVEHDVHLMGMTQCQRFGPP
jgi:hypothetical protein